MTTPEPPDLGRGAIIGAREVSRRLTPRFSRGSVLEDCFISDPARTGPARAGPLDRRGGSRRRRDLAQGRDWLELLPS